MMKLNRPGQKAYGVWLEPRPKLIDYLPYVDEADDVRKGCNLLRIDHNCMAGAQLR